MGLASCYQNKKVLVTGHTGFKGTWLCLWLQKLGAHVGGYSLPEWPNDRFFQMTQLADTVQDYRGDIGNLKELQICVHDFQPDIIFHLAAQPLVRDSYQSPVETFWANVVGTANVLECMRASESPLVGVMITTDKCYENTNQDEGYVESDKLGGHDPYSASKAAAEIVISSYRDSFLSEQGKLTASARAGNVIGGGDYSKDRIIPDCVSAIQSGTSLEVRSPHATRPWQHVLEPLVGYLLLGSKLLAGEKQFADAWNFGPEMSSVWPVSDVVTEFFKCWGAGEWKDVSGGKTLHEAAKLQLDISKAKRELNWVPCWEVEKAIQMTAEWYKNLSDSNAEELCLNQIEEYEGVESKR